MLFSDEQVDTQAIENELQEIETIFEELGESELLSDYLESTAELSLAKKAAKRDMIPPLKAYQYTAGEIEARDAANRMNWSEELRRETFPESAEENPDRVFVKDSGVSYAIKIDNKGNKYWEIETEKDIFKGLCTVSDYEDAAYSFILGNRDNKVVYEDINGKKIKFIRLSAKEFTNSDESKLLKKEMPDIFKKKMRLISSLQDLLLSNSVEWESPDFKEHKLFAEKGFRNYRGRVRIDDVIFNSIVRVGMTEKDNIFYDINLEVDSTVPRTNNSASQISKSTSIDTTISQDNTDVNTYSMQNQENNAKEYKLQEPTELDTDLQAENAELKRQLEDVHGRLKEAQNRAASAEECLRPQVLEKDIQSLAGKLIKEYGSDLKKTDITDDLRDLGNYILRMGDGNDVYSFDSLQMKIFFVCLAYLNEAEGSA